MSGAPTDRASTLAPALLAIVLWATLAALGLRLGHVPPFLLTGIGLLVGGLLGLPAALRHPVRWRVPLRWLALGVYGLFGFHLLLFVALRLAPPVEANLVNYLWPLLIVVLAPAFVPGVRLRAAHVVAAVLGLAGAALAITSGRGTTTGGAPIDPSALAGYAAAVGSALVWASYTLVTRRWAGDGGAQPSDPAAAVRLYGVVSGILALACHGVFEPSAPIDPADAPWLLALGAGPLGLAFVAWDRAIKGGDVRLMGVLSYLTPLLSTLVLTVVTGRAWTWALAGAAALIIGAGVLGWWAGREPPTPVQTL